jgi:hypothetical protein
MAGKREQDDEEIKLEDIVHIDRVQRIMLRETEKLSRVSKSIGNAVGHVLLKKAWLVKCFEDERQHQILQLRI